MSCSWLQIATTSADNTLKLWFLDAFEVARALNMPLSEQGKDSFTCPLLLDTGLDFRLAPPMTFSPQAKIEECFNTMVGHKSEVTKVAFSGDGRRLATVGDGMVAHVMWASNDGKHMTNLVGHSDRLTSIAWSKQGRVVATGCNDGKVGLWDIDLFDRLAEQTQMKSTCLSTYNDDSCKQIIQSYPNGQTLPTES